MHFSKYLNRVVLKLAHTERMLNLSFTHTIDILVYICYVRRKNVTILFSWKLFAQQTEGKLTMLSVQNMFLQYFSLFTAGLKLQRVFFLGLMALRSSVKGTEKNNKTHERLPNIMAIYPSGQVSCTQLLYNAHININMQEDLKWTRLHLWLRIARKLERGDMTDISVHLGVENSAASNCDSLFR